MPRLSESLKTLVAIVVDKNREESYIEWLINIAESFEQAANLTKHEMTEILIWNEAI